MSDSRGGPIPRTTRGENRFYVSPGMRKQQQLQKQKPLIPKIVVPEAEKRLDSSECHFTSSANCSVSGRVRNESSPTNLDRFLEHTTPLVPAQFLPRTSVRGWRNGEVENHPYFVLEDLWESFSEWSAYGAGVPLLLNGSETVMQYYVPYLSGIQLYIDQSRPNPKLRRPGGESDAESSKETSSDGSSDYGAERAVNSGVWGPQTLQNLTNANIQSFNRLSTGNKSLTGSSSDECETSISPDRLVFEYMEHDPPFTRQPLANKISFLASQFPELKTYRSCDLSSSSWVSVAWYPIYRIPTGPTLQNLDASFLTFHTLSTPLQSQHVDGMHLQGSNSREGHYADTFVKLPLPTFALVTYKFWNPNGLYECQKIKSLWQAAHSWLRRLQVYHPDYGFFVSRTQS